MGWFFNRNNNASDQNNHADSNDAQNPHFTFQNSFSSTSRSCKNDPEDCQFMICKTVVKDQNGTREHQEKIPVNNGFSSNKAGSNYQSASPFRNSLHESEKVFDKLPSFFVQPSFFDFHNSALQPNGQNQSEIQSFSRSYSQSRSCKPDPEDKEYLICMSKIKDENGVQQIQERVKASNATSEMGSFGHEIDKQMHNFLNQMNSGVNMMMPFFGSMINLVNDLQNIQKSMNYPFSEQNQHYFPKSQHYFPHNPQNNQSRPEQDKSHYFSPSQSKKDTNIYDL